MIHQPFSATTSTLHLSNVPFRIQRHKLGIRTSSPAVIIVRRWMPLVGSSLLRPSTVIIGAWTAEDKEVKGTHSRDAGGYDDEVDLDAVVDKVSILHGMVRAW